VRSRILVFAGVIFSITTVAVWLVTATWRNFVGGRGFSWEGKFVLFALTAGFVPALILGFRYRHPLLRLASLLTASAMGFLSFGLVAAVVCWLARAGAWALGLPVNLPRLAETVFGLAGLVGCYGLANSVFPRTVRLTVPLPGLPAAWRDQTVALVTDVHLGNVRGAAFAAHLVWRLRRLHPQAVFISGDMFDGTKLDLPRAVKPWSGLTAPRGVYFVSGNHDDMRNRAQHLAAISAVGIRVLNNESIRIDGLQLIGVHDAETDDPELFRDILRRANVAPETTSILLAHKPSNLDVAEAAGLSLQLSGHTHGGQFWPWSLIAGRVHGKFVHGLNRFGRMLVYTSSGAGTWGPPFRVGTQSEIVLLRLVPALTA
jgi:hypothetical protein